MRNIAFSILLICNWVAASVYAFDSCQAFFDRRSHPQYGQQIFAERYGTLLEKDILEMPLSQFRNLQKLPIPETLSNVAQESGYSGLGFRYLLSGLHAENSIFIKFPSRATYMQQVRLYRYLSDLGIGPKFYGVTRDENGHIGIVLEFIPGIHLGDYTTGIENSFPVTMKSYRAIEHLKSRLIESGLVYGIDLQIRLTSDGRAFVIDPESLRFEKFLPGQSTKIQEYDSFADKFFTQDLTLLPDKDLMLPLQEIDTILANLKKVLIQRKQWTSDASPIRAPSF